jgi:hypothetical protein
VGDERADEGGDCYAEGECSSGREPPDRCRTGMSASKATRATSSGPLMRAVDPGSCANVYAVKVAVGVPHSPPKEEAQCGEASL